MSPGLKTPISPGNLHPWCFTGIETSARPAKKQKSLNDFVFLA
jgi:hypothetical protein